MKGVLSEEKEEKEERAAVFLLNVFKSMWCFTITQCNFYYCSLYSVKIGSDDKTDGVNSIELEVRSTKIKKNCAEFDKLNFIK